ncbi:MAG: amidohydrolase family protein, partial [Carbonactinosporaceae bacterium]
MGRPGGRLHDQLAGMPLVDHHCHGVVSRQLDRTGLEALLTEAPEAGPPGTSPFDSLLGVAVRRWCAPLLDLPAHAPPDDYVQRRLELGGRAVARRFLTATGASDLLLDVGLGAGELLGPDEMAAISGARTHRVVRLETVAEGVAAGTSGADFAAAFEDALTRQLRGAVAVKSIAAYRGGLALDPRPPGLAEVD